MVSNLVVYQLVLIALGWVFLLLYRVWPAEPAAARPIPSPPVTPPRKRSTAPKPFMGLTRKPHCDACVQAIEALRLPRPSAPPPKIGSTRGRRRHVDPARHFCPDADCRYGGWGGWAISVPTGLPTAAPGASGIAPAVAATRSKRPGPCCMASASRPTCWGGHGGSGRRVGQPRRRRGFEVAPNTVLQGLVEAAEQLQALSPYFLHDVRGTQGPLDALFALLSAVQASEGREAEAITRLSRFPHGVWVAMDPGSTLLLAIDVGTRTLAMAPRVVPQGVQVLAPDCAPLCLTDGFTESITAFLTPYGHWVQPERQRLQGPAPKRRWMPLPQLLYAPVIKTIRCQRLIRVRHRVVFGTLEAVEQVVAVCGWQSQTAFIERVNLAMRQQLAL
jgi:hypothetical protein